jgi:hypothetical protein
MLQYRRHAFAHVCLSVRFDRFVVLLQANRGDGAVPNIGPQDTNSLKGPILPWLRSIDGIETHDEAYRFSVAGGITTYVQPSPYRI